MIKNRFNILVVDDTKLNVEILIDLLEDQYNIIPSLSGEKVMKIVKKMDIDLILLDIMMPDMDGFEVCKLLKSNPETKDIPIIFITAKTDEDSIEEAYEIGGIDYITKPFKPKELLAKVKREFKFQELTEKTRSAEMGEMINMLAHQWKQPLSAIASTTLNLELSIELGEIDFGSKEQNQLFLDEFRKMEGFIKDLTKIIDNFRNFYQPDNKIVKIKLKDLVDNILADTCNSFKEENINVICSYDEDYEIELYVTEVIQVILNLLKNAQRNFIENEIKDREIKIEIGKDKITICDNGGGIDKNIMKKIFDPYFSTKNEKNGVGLGLYISKLIIEKHHNGKLSAVNSDDGVCFIIDFGLI